MTHLTDNLLDQALRLPFDERVELADRLLASLHPEADDATPEEIRDAWAAELTRRVAESDAGVPGVPAEEVWKKLDARRRLQSTS